jgi:hypothetical protein
MRRGTNDVPDEHGCRPRRFAAVSRAGISGGNVARAAAPLLTSAEAPVGKPGAGHVQEISGRCPAAKATLRLAVALAKTALP